MPSAKPEDNNQLIHDMLKEIAHPNELTVIPCGTQDDDGQAANFYTCNHWNRMCEHAVGVSLAGNPVIHPQGLTQNLTLQPDEDILLKCGPEVPVKTPEWRTKENCEEPLDPSLFDARQYSRYVEDKVRE